MMIAVAGLTLAVLAEFFSVGLVGLSGWFIASSAVAGAAAYSTFSYVNPSGGVRAFAVGRIATSYASRVVLHSAALRRISAARLNFYDRAVAKPDPAGTWSGESLDRVMADADSRGMVLIQAIAPMVVAVGVTVGGCLVIVAAGYPVTAMIVAVAAAACAVLAVAAVRQGDDESRARGALRAELVTAVEAWTEMASLGAADRLAQRTLWRLAAFEGHRLRRAATRARTISGTRAVSAIALLLAIVSTSSSGADVATLVFVALLAVGVMLNAERLVAAAEAQLASRQASARLNSAAVEGPLPAQPGGPTFRAVYGPDGLSISGYWLPETPTREGRWIGLAAAAGETLVVTGSSGSGKTTLLNAIETALRGSGTQPPSGVVTAVLAEDYLFTGTVASNIRLADPTAADDEIRDLIAIMCLDRGGIEPGTRIGVGGRDLSGGEQRRLHIARALAARPDVLLIDEPTTGLDRSTASHVLKAVRHRLPRAVLVLAMHQLPAGADALGPVWSKVSLDENHAWRNTYIGVRPVERHDDPANLKSTSEEHGWRWRA